jgi:preprotein translocase subunit SecA
MHDTSEKQIVSAVVYSDKEYNLTIDAISKKYGLTEETVSASLQDWTAIGDGRSMKVRINTKKKVNTDTFAEIIIQSETSDNTIEQDLHYGLFILGTEKHDSRRIDNQLR